MELSVLLMVLLGCSLTWASPIVIKKDKDNGHNAIEPSPVDNKRSFSYIISHDNKDLPFPLKNGDIRRKISRSLVQDPIWLWKKSANGIVQIPFQLDSKYSDTHKKTLKSAIDEFAVMTCVQFVNRTNEDDYVRIEAGNGCWSYVGKTGGAQPLGIALPDCVEYYVIQHELIHALGFKHEQNRKDRDQYIDILWENVSPDARDTFDVEDGDTQDLPYGYSSVMHYSSDIYSMNGQPTMVAKSDPNMPLGQDIGMDDQDIKKINKAYDCNLCRRKFLGSSGTINYNSVFSSQEGSNCLYLIQTPPDQILLQFSYLNVPLSPKCGNAYIKVYDGISESSPVILDKTCGSGPITPIFSSGQHLLIEIMSKKPSPPITFNASYQSEQIN